MESSVLFVGLLHIPFIVDCKQRKDRDRSACFFTSGHERRTKKPAQVLVSCNPVTLSEHQGHSNWYLTVEFSVALHHTKFEICRFTSVLAQDDVKGIFHKITAAEFSP